MDILSATGLKWECPKMDIDVLRWTQIRGSPGVENEGRDNLDLAKMISNKKKWS